MRILIVEDELKTREGLLMLVRYLRPDAEVSAAECGQKALELCRDFYYDLIFTDIKMPGMNGFQMLSQLDRKGRMIVIVSGYADFSYARQAIRFSVLDYVLKPVSAVKIKDILNLAYEQMELARDGCLYSYLTGYEALSDEAREYYWDKLELSGEFALILFPAGPAGDTGHKMESGIRKLKAQGRFRIVTAVIRDSLYVLLGASGQGNLQEGIRLLAEYTGAGQRMHAEGPSRNKEDLRLFYRDLSQKAVYGCAGQSVCDTVRLVKDFILQNLDTNISLAMLAEVAFVHPAYLSTLFKKETGENLTEYIVGCRINRAKELLKNPAGKIYEVAVAVGYNDAKYFSSVFKNETGMTPREWRRLH